MVTMLVPMIVLILLEPKPCTIILSLLIPHCALVHNNIAKWGEVAAYLP